MHLKQLKLAGFKSFLDPVIVYFPSQLVAVVGPNGCGKSNIIDAVRWVMGESSAKNLRGDSMTDVIFNGSSQRKPLGQALVELIFDNSLGRLTGPFASYGEIAVKRVVSRDGESNYYLNGARCQRKDITDIFLGTGAGTKGYSIIGQGTISRLIEAKPEELRAHLEEAAGVSKYKERRRETLQRIAQTRDNLTRVADIREELAKQLQRLERQAKSAQRYTQLKEEEKLCRAQILALKWQDFTTQAQSKRTELHDLALSYEQQQSLLVNANMERTKAHEQSQGANENLQQTQATLYQFGTEIARLEEIIQQQEREKKRIEQDRLQLQTDCQKATEQVYQDKEELVITQQNAQLLQSKIVELIKEYQDIKLCWEQANLEKMAFEQRNQEMHALNTTLKGELQVAQINLKHCEQKQQQALLKVEDISINENAQQLEDLKLTQQELHEQQVYLKQQQQQEEDKISQAANNLAQLREQLLALEQNIRTLQDSYHHKNSELSALKAIQQAAIYAQGVDSSSTDIPRLVNQLQVEPKWQIACETVLQQSLQAYVVEELNFDALSEKSNGATFLSMRGLQGEQQTLPRLADKIQGAIPSTVPLLEHIFTAENLQQAINWIADLMEHESVITADGYWLGKRWVKCINNDQQDAIGLLTRQQKIADLAPIVEELAAQIAAGSAQRDTDYERLQQQAKIHDELKDCHIINNQILNDNSNALIINQKTLEQLEQTIANKLAEKTQLLKIIEELAVERFEIDEQIMLLNEQQALQQQNLTQLIEEKQNFNNTFELHNASKESLQTQLHQAEMQCDRETIKIQQVENRIAREQERLLILEERAEQLLLQSFNLGLPADEFKDQLAVQLTQHIETEALLIAKKEQISSLRLQLKHLEQFTYNCDLEVKRIQELIAQCRMHEQELSVRANSVQELLDELEFDAQSLLNNLDSQATQCVQEAKLLALTEQIKRLGAINLAAIEEFTHEQQRKLYLDEQYEDLSQALLTLEAAIEKMDNETRLRLETTFDEVNTAFKSLFPRLFGGGKAQLELTCDNLLEAGIVVMAQPPGKRNSTIHLLSGGEKAMTAVALVFAIFQLNPSPFCMLDEVDAPLDDVNVGRFCALVKEMSQFVQFLFITHNKVTMELADHLIGVTMREPGVSRLVAVDVKQDLTME